MVARGWAARRVFRLGTDPQPAPTPVPSTEPSDAAVEAADQQWLDHTCGERTWVEMLALAGVIGVNDQQALIPELWNVINPGQSTFSGGTTVEDMATLAQYVAQKFNIHAHMVALGPAASSLTSNLDADDQGGIVNVIDSCRTVDFGSDRYTPDQLVAAAQAVVGNDSCGWAVTLYNADRSVALLKAVTWIVDLSVITPVQGYHWLMAH